MFSFAGFLMCMIPLPWHLQGAFYMFALPSDSDKLISVNSMEYRNVHVHDMECLELSELLHQLDHLERKC